MLRIEKKVHLDFACEELIKRIFKSMLADLFLKTTIVLPRYFFQLSIFLEYSVKFSYETKGLKSILYSKSN